MGARGVRARVPVVEGSRFGRLVVLVEAPRRPARAGQAEATARTQPYRRYWRCQCDCGATSLVLQQSLSRGSTRSCGCLRQETCAITGHLVARRRQITGRAA